MPYVSTGPRPTPALSPVTAPALSAQASEARSRGAGTGAGPDFASWLSALPDPVKRVGSAVGTGLGALTSLESAVNLVAPGAGTRGMDRIRSVPYVGRPLAEVADTVGSPLSLATIGFGGWIGAAAKAGKLGLAGRLAAPFVAPVLEGGTGARAIGQLGVAGGSAAAGAAADQMGADPIVGTLARLGGGLAGAGSLRALTVGTPNLLKEADVVGQDLFNADRLSRARAALLGGGTEAQTFGTVASAALPPKVSVAARASRSAGLPGAAAGLPEAGGSGTNFSRSLNLPAGAAKLAEAQTKLRSAAFTPQGIQEMSAQLAVHPFTPEQKQLAQQGFAKLLLGQVPENGQLNLLEQALGTRVRTAADLMRDASTKFAGRLSKGGMQMPTDAANNLRATVSKGIYTPGERALAESGLRKMLAGEVPAGAELTQLRKTLGSQADDAASILREGYVSGLSLGEQAMDALGVPRSIMASMDLSAPFRQGAVLVGRKQFWKNLGPMAQAFGSETYTKHVDDLLRSDELISKASKFVSEGGYGLHLDDLFNRDVVQRAEGFTSRLAGQIPGVRMSERAYVTFLNKLRADTFKSTVNGWQAAGKAVDETDLVSLARWINTATGRGGGSEASAFLTDMDRLFFAPRLWVSRIDALTGGTWARGNATALVRAEARKDMLRFFGAGMTALGMVSAAGSIVGKPTHVELDPRSTDFGKVRIGDTRFDPWAGFQPIARYLAQLITGEQKTQSGEIRSRGRGEVLAGFARSKLAPVPSFLVDALTGSNFIGQEVDVTKAGGLSRSTAERIAPLFAQDMLDAIRNGSPEALALTPLTGLGFGVQTYQSTTSIRETGAEAMFKRPWAKLTGEEQVAVENAYAEELSRQQPPMPDSAAGFIDSEGLALRAFEQDANTWRQQGGDPRTFTEQMMDRNQTRIDRINGRLAAEGGRTEGQDLLDRFFALREQAVNPAGVVDYEKLDQLQANFLEGLTPEDRAVVEKRRAFQHAPEVQWWVDARKTINDSGYWKQQNEAMDRLRGLVGAVAPGVETYNQLVFASTNKDLPAAQRRRIEAVVSRVDKLTETARIRQRRANPELDRALNAVYGTKRITRG